jgi:hypothetical protein
MLTVEHITNEEIIMTTPQQPQRLKPEELNEIVKQVQALRAITKMTGVFTARRIGFLLTPLCTEDLVIVSQRLQLKPRELPRDRFGKPLELSHGVKRFDENGVPEKNYNH